jgi:DNA-binding response OmpR family regulator
VTVCPCCGGETDRPFVIDLSANVISCGGKTVRLRPQIAEMLYALAREYPKTVPYARIIGAVWGINEPQRPLDQLRVLASYARPDLAPLGLSIGCRPRVGFFLTSEDPANATAARLAVRSCERRQAAA